MWGGRADLHGNWVKGGWGSRCWMVLLDGEVEWLIGRRKMRDAEAVMNAAGRR